MTGQSDALRSQYTAERTKVKDGFVVLVNGPGLSKVIGGARALLPYVMLFADVDGQWQVVGMRQYPAAQSHYGRPTMHLKVTAV